MTELRKVSGKDTISALEKLGFTQVRQKGSHIVMRKFLPQGDKGCVVPLHKELKIGTLKGILRQAKVSVDEFMKVIK